MDGTAARDVTRQVPRRWRRTGRVGVLITAILALSLVGTSTVAAASQSITSTGPLTRVEISDELNCAVDHASDAVPEFYGDTACGTLIATGGTLFRPTSIPAGNSAAPFTPYTLVSQSSITGAGTLADPYKVVTVVDLGTTGLRATETDSYVVGQEAYRTDVTIQNLGATSADAILYRAGDCYLQNSDDGFGAVDATTGSVSCVGSVDDGSGGQVPGTRIEQWYPLSPGSRYYHAFFDDVWAWIGSQQPFPNTCQCTSYIDNGAGLSWTLTIPAGEAVTRSHLTVFSPVGIEPLTATKTAASPTTAAGGANSYTITISNPNDTAAGLASIFDTLPAGFSYVAGSTTGATTSNPGVVGQLLTWTGPFVVPASGTLTLTFGVTVSAQAGTYTNEAGATGQDQFIILPTGPTAPVTVEAEAVNPAPTTNAGADKNGTEGSAVSLDGTVSNEPAGDTVTTTWSYTLGAGTDAGMTCSFGDASAVDTTITCTDDGTVTVKLTADDGVNPPVEDTATLTIANADPTVSITSPADGGGATVGATVNLTASRGDPGANDTHTCSIDWGDGTVEAGTLTATTCTGSHQYTAIGVPTITVTIADDDGDDATDEIMLVVSAPGSKVTGGGWITQGDGKLRFGLVAQGSEGEIQVRWAGHRFHGKTVSGLVVAKPQASWTGTGRYDGTAGYTYEVTVRDNGNGGGKHKTPDTFAIVIRDGGGAVVFSASGSLGGGNLKIH